MNGKNNINKGNELEEAVYFIEKTILNSNPSLKNSEFLIETKKIIIKNGVKHEIDVYVEINLGHGYNTIFIFECKNWKKAVGKNEIIDFSEKTKVIAAQKGFFVSNSYSKYAINQGKLDNRLELLNISNSNANFLSFPDLHMIERNQSETNINVLFSTQDSKSQKILNIDIKKAKLILNGEIDNLESYIFKTCDKIIEKNLNKEQTQKLSSGKYFYEYKHSINCKKNVLIIDDNEIGKVDFTIKFPLYVIRPKVKYKFDIRTKGKILKYEDKFNSGQTVGLTFVRLEKD